MDYANLTEDVALPKASVDKLIRLACGEGVKASGDAKAAMAAVCAEFVGLLTAQAQELCAASKGKGNTILSKHVLDALKELGLDELVEPVTKFNEVIEKASDEHKAKRKKLHSNDSGMTEEEAIKAQQELFAKARARMEGSAGAP